MDDRSPQVVEQVCEELPPGFGELSDLALSEVGAGMCDPGIIDIEK